MITFLVGWLLIALAFTYIVHVAEARTEPFNKYHVASILSGSLAVTSVAQFLLWLLGWL